MTTYTKSGKPRKKRAKTGRVCSMSDFGQRNLFPWDMCEIVSANGTVETVAVMVADNISGSRKGKTEDHEEYVYVDLNGFT